MFGKSGSQAIRARMRRPWAPLTLLLLAHADPALAEDERNDPWRIAWAGGIATEDSWLLYSGATTAPFGPIDSNGVRIRATSGHGEYDYCGTYAFRGDCHHAGTYRGRATFSDVLVGYHQNLGPLTAKAFLGVSRIDNDLDPHSPQYKDVASGVEWGPKLAVELWLDPGGSTWTSLNFSGTTAHDTYSVASRTAYRIMPQLDIGSELSLDGNGMNIEGSSAGAFARLYGRSGLFLRYTWDRSELTLSGGISGEVRDMMPEPYGSLAWAAKF